VTLALALEAVVLAMFALGFWQTSGVRDAAALHGLIVLSAVAMGIQSAAVRQLEVPGIATTYMTGTLTSAVTGFVAGSLSVGGPGRPDAALSPSSTALGWRRAVRLQLLSLLIYGLGATIGGLAQHRWPVAVAVVPIALVLAVVALASQLDRAARA
jgi:uncharacterized membrane protein YoaK (UPF0700 family)